MRTFEPLLPLFVPSFSSKGNLFIPTESGALVSDNYDLLKALGIRVSNSYLVSAYDIYYGYIPTNPEDWPYTDYLFVDSGGYEISDAYDLSERNKFNYNVQPWDKEKMKQVYHMILSCPKFNNSTIVLSGFDLIASFEEQLVSILELADEFPNAILNFLVKITFPFSDLLDIIKKNYERIRSIKIIGLTEKEMGNTVYERLLNLISLKKLLNSLGWNGVIHIFGGLEPNLSKLYYVAGADIFDGLSWQKVRYGANASLFAPNCYNIALGEYENKYLMMIDNLAALHEMANDLLDGPEMRLERMNRLADMLNDGEASIQTILSNLEVTK